MDGPAWTDAVSAIGSIATPVVVVILGVVLSRRQGRSEQLLEARIDYYRLLAPDLNSLMCYMSFIGSWRDLTPVEIVSLKRRLDHNFYCAVPLFSEPVRTAYAAFEARCFSTFNEWGRDAVILSSAYRRRQAWVRSDLGWNDAWDQMFSKEDAEPISGQELTETRRTYDRLIAALVKDLDITRTRAEYTTNAVSLNAHLAARGDIDGEPT